jgi:hypothetical protein
MRWPGSRCEVSGVEWQVLPERGSIVMVTWLRLKNDNVLPRRLCDTSSGAKGILYQAAIEICLQRSDE